MANQNVCRECGDANGKCIHSNPPVKLSTDKVKELQNKTESKKQSDQPSLKDKEKNQ